MKHQIDFLNIEQYTLVKTHLNNLRVLDVYAGTSTIGVKFLILPNKSHLNGTTNTRYLCKKLPLAASDA
jgi:hypothetical protein